MSEQPSREMIAAFREAGIGRRYHKRSLRDLDLTPPVYKELSSYIYEYGTREWCPAVIYVYGDKSRELTHVLARGMVIANAETYVLSLVDVVPCFSNSEESHRLFGDTLALFGFFEETYESIPLTKAEQRVIESVLLMFVDNNATLILEGTSPAEMLDRWWSKYFLRELKSVGMRSFMV